MKSIRNCAKALIIHDGCLLAIKMRDEDGAFFILPGGGQEPGETLADALRRECREELSVEVVVHELRYVREQIREAHRIEFIFRCMLKTPLGTSGGTHPDDGQLGLAWLSLPYLQQVRLYPLELRSLLDGLDAEGAPVYLGDIA